MTNAMTNVPLAMNGASPAFAAASRSRSLVGDGVAIPAARIAGWLLRAWIWILIATLVGAVTGVAVARLVAPRLVPATFQPPHRPHRATATLAPELATTARLIAAASRPDDSAASMRPPTQDDPNVYRSRR